MRLPFFLIAGIVLASPQATVDPYRTLLDSLGSAPHTVLIREYELDSGGLGRLYATDLPSDHAPTTVTVFYRDQLLAQGWHRLEQHATVSGYAKGDIKVCIFLGGPDYPPLPPDARLLKSATPPMNVTLFFEIEATPRR